MTFVRSEARVREDEALMREALEALKQDVVCASCHCYLESFCQCQSGDPPRAAITKLEERLK